MSVLHEYFLSREVVLFVGRQRHVCSWTSRDAPGPLVDGGSSLTLSPTEVSGPRTADGDCPTPAGMGGPAGSLTPAVLGAGPIHPGFPLTSALAEAGSRSSSVSWIACSEAQLLSGKLAALRTVEEALWKCAPFEQGC